MNLDISKVETLLSKINIDRKKIIDIALASIALEQDGLSRIVKAEGDKLKQIMSKKNSSLNPEEFLAINESIQKTLREVSKKEMLLDHRIQNIIDLIEKAKKLDC